MAFYECVFIARQDISSAQVEGLTEGYTKIIEENGGKVTKNEYWGLRTMAYRIKKNRKGHYVMFNVDAPSPAVLEMERNMRISDDVLRYLTVRVDELEEGPSVIMQQRNGRDDRGGRGGRGDRGDRGGHGRPRGGGEEAPSSTSQPKAEAKAEPKTEAKAEPKAETASNEGASQ
jgi:small subunit ribosomal protein S6